MMRMRKSLVLAIVLISTSAVAQTNPNCIHLEQSWTRQFPSGTIPYITYQIPNNLLITTQTRNTKYMNILLNVPQSVPQRLQALPSADAYFSQIHRQYHEGLLNENGCPILYEPRAGIPPATKFGIGGVSVLTGRGSLFLTLGPVQPAVTAIGDFAPVWSR